MAVKENMILKDGHYELTLDLSSCPQLKTQTGSSRIKTGVLHRDQGKMRSHFFIQEKNLPDGSSAGKRGRQDDRYYAYIFYPGRVLSDADGLWIYSVPRQKYGLKQEECQGGQMQPLERFRHREVFEADYKIDLEKYCAETGQPLAGAADFQVWESFDHS